MKKDLKSALIVGHRGAAAKAPENTIISLQVAKQEGATWVEFDIMMLKDGELIVMHDETLDRTTNGEGLVAKKTYEDIQSLEAGSWFACEFKTAKIPTFKQYLEELKRLNLHPIVELKDNGTDKNCFVEHTLACVKAYWDVEKNPLIFFSGSPEILRIIKQNWPGVRVGQVMDEWDEGILMQFEKDGFEIACLNYLTLSAERIDRLSQLQRQIAVYTVNDKAVFLDLARKNIDYLITDDPGLQSILHKEESPC